MSRRLPTEHVTWLKEARAGCPHAMEQLLSFHERLIYRVASQFRRAELDPEDLLAECRLGFLLAVRAYEPSRGLTFSTCAWTYMRNHVVMVLRATRSLIRLPKQVWEERRLLWKAADRYFTANGREPSAEDLADLTGLPLSRVTRALKSPYVACSLDEMTLLEGDEYCLTACFGELLGASPADMVEREVLDRWTSEQLEQAVEDLGEPLTSVIRLRYGLGGEPMTTAKVAEVLDLSRFTVHLMEKGALLALRDALASLE